MATSLTLLPPRKSWNPAASTLHTPVCFLWGLQGNREVPQDSGPSTCLPRDTALALTKTIASSQLLRSPGGCSGPAARRPTGGMAPLQLTGTQLDGKLSISSEPSTGPGSGLPLLLLYYRNPRRQALSVPTPQLLVHRATAPGESGLRGHSRRNTSRPVSSCACQDPAPRYPPQQSPPGPPSLLVSTYYAPSVKVMPDRYNFRPPPQPLK